MKVVFLIWNWLCGSFAGLLSILFIDENAWGGLCFFLIALLLLPPAREMVYSKTEKALPALARVILIGVLFVISGGFFVEAENQRKTEEKVQKENQRRGKLQNEFQKNRSNILYEIKSYLRMKQNDKALLLSSRYVFTGDKELKKFYDIAKERALFDRKRAAAQKKSKHKQLLKKVPQN